MIRVKVLGYEAFTLPENPSALLVESCRKDPLPGLAGRDVEVSWGTVPVVTTALRARLERELEDRPDTLFVIGQAGNKSQVALERFGVNMKDFSTPDQEGNTADSEPIREDGPPAYQSTIPDLRGCAVAIRAVGVPAVVSNHAGTHMCNQALYTSLDIVSTKGLSTMCGFIHVPLLDTQLANVPASDTRHAMSHALSLDALRRALEAILVHTVDALEGASAAASV